jgi:hypothetical protein
MIRIALALLLILQPLSVIEAAKKEPRSGLGPCRIAAQALVSYLDGGEEKSGEYAHAYSMVDTCGPVRSAKAKLKRCGR